MVGEPGLVDPTVNEAVSAPPLMLQLEEVNSVGSEDVS